MCNLKAVSPKTTENIRVNGENDLALLYEWLEALLLKFEIEQKVYSEFKVKLLRISEGTFGIDAVVSGEEYDRRKHGAKVEVKAVTYHRMEIARDGAMVVVRFILDL